MIASMPLSTLADACGGQVVASLADADVRLSGLAIDSRAVKPGDLFAALPGSQVDGHDFVSKAQCQGAGAALVLRALDSDLPQLVVEDQQQALAAFGRLARSAFDGVLVGITGSAGKTTAKNLLASVLAEAGQVLATEGNRNNELGVPLTLANLDPGTEYAVLEMGAGKPDDIAWLVNIAHPTVAVLLNVAPAHVERFGSVDAIANTKAAIFDQLPASGLAVFGADQPWCDEWRERASPARVLTFGLSASADYRAVDIVDCGFDGVAFTVVTPENRFPIKLAIPGRQGIDNGLAAIAVAHALGLSSSAIQRGLSSVKPAAGRGKVYQLASGAHLVDDSYNANPMAVKAAIDVLATRAGVRRLVLGPMLELGEQHEQLHHEVGRYAHDAGIEEFWVVDPRADAAAQGFGAAARRFESVAELLAEDPSLSADHTVLIKASRGAALDRVVTDWLANEEGEPC